MSDSALETVNPDRPSDSGPLATTDAPHENSGAGLVAGQRWRDYLIEAPFPAGGPDAFLAEHVNEMKKVVVRAFPIDPTTEWRRGAWDRLCALSNLKVIRPLSAEEELGWRYEVSAVPPAMTLREWIACHRPVFKEIESMMAQFAATLGALHAQGVVHLNIQPDSIYIDDAGPEPTYLLGGFHKATLYTQPDAKPREVDPLYAPPEAVDPNSGPLSGTRLCAWDWWTVGRVVQEFVIGRHVLALVLNRELATVTPELRASAEQILLERGPAGVRAGALEGMTMEAGLKPLLRGLLTGSLEARWGLDALQRWLKQEPVLDHYDLPRQARMWVWKGRAFTIAEAAEHFTQARTWDEGEEMLFNVERPETLAAFLRESPAHREDAARLQAVCDASESTAWSDVPVVARKTVTAAVAWLALANGSGVRTPLRIRGQTVDALGLAELLRACGPADGAALVGALLVPAVIACIEPADASAARVLTTLAGKATEALKHGAQHGWLDPHDSQAQARIYEISLKAGALLRERIELLRSQYSTNANEALAALLATKSPPPRDAVILAFTAEAPERYKYITHAAWRRQCQAALEKQAQTIVRSLFWIHARQFLAATRVWGVPTPWFAGGVLVLTVLAMGLTKSFAAPAEVAGALLLARIYFSHRMTNMVHAIDPAAPRWAWSDGLPRAVAEAKKMGANSPALTVIELNTELQRLQTEIGVLAKATKENSRLPLPRWWDLWATALGSVGITLIILGGAVLERPFSREPASVRSARNPKESVVNAPNSVATLPKTPSAPAAPKVDIEALIRSGRYELVDDGFGRQLRGPLRPWTFYATGKPAPVEIVAKAPASAEQSAFALVSGTVLLQPYSRKAVKVLLALRVPTSRGFGFMIFNTSERQLMDHDVRLARQPLQDHTWFQLGSKRILFLATPAALASEISLAPQ